MQCIVPSSAFSAETCPFKATPPPALAALTAQAHAEPNEGDGAGAGGSNPLQPAEKQGFAGDADAANGPTGPGKQGPHDARPIGVFDSGVGGLTVVRALRARLPHERIVYLGDTARVPYGVRSADVVRRYAASCARFLLQQGAKMVVVACNTASAHALADLQADLPVPVLGVIEAGARLAAETFRTGEVGVLATEGTVLSQAYPRALACLAPQLKVVQQACPLFVPLCEEGLTSHPATRLIAQDYLQAFAGLELNALLLGCTHYPLLAPLLQQLLGPGVQLIDSATAVAESVCRSLEETRLFCDPNQASDAPPLALFATDVTARLRRVAQNFLGGPVPQVTLVDLPA